MRQGEEYMHACLSHPTFRYQLEKAVNSLWHRSHSKDRDDYRQDLLERLWKSFERYDMTKSLPQTFGAVCVRNAASNILRGLRRSKISECMQLGEDLDKVHYDPRFEALIDIEDSIKGMRPIQRDAAHLIMQGYDCKGAAEVLGVSREAVRKYRKQLAVVLR
jgi:DNA-directed RNA polymerase specialized sigma24 family protein